MMTVDDVLRTAKSAGVTVLVEGYDLVLEHQADPPPNLVAMLRHYKPELVSALRMREAEQRSLVAQWINDHFAPSPPGRLRPLRRRRASRGPLSFSCSSETIGARCTAHVTRHGWLSERPKRVRRCDFNGLLMSGHLVSRRADHDSAGDETFGSIALRRERHLRGWRRRPRGRRLSRTATGSSFSPRSVIRSQDVRRGPANDIRRLSARNVQPHDGGAPPSRNPLGNASPQGTGLAAAPPKMVVRGFGKAGAQSTNLPRPSAELTGCHQ